MNNDNLTPHNLKFASASRRREMARMGRLAAAENSRRKKAIREVAEIIMNMKHPLRNDIVKQFAALGIDKEELTTQFLAVYKQGKKAMDGDLAALTFLRDTCGEKPIENVKLAGGIGADVVITVGGEEVDD